MARLGLAATTLATIALAAGATTGEAAVAGCGDASGKVQARSAADRTDLVVGPLTFVHALAHGDSSPESIERIGGFKSPALLRRGHTAEVSIDRASRSNVRLTYGTGKARNEAAFARFPHTVAFRACPRRSLTFWSGFFIVRDAPACIGVTIRIDGRRARHRTIPVAQEPCP